MPLTPEEEALIEIDPPGAGIDSPLLQTDPYLGASGPIPSPLQADPYLVSGDAITSPLQVDSDLAAAIYSVPMGLTPAEEAQIEIDPPSSQSVKVAGRGFGPDTGQGAVWEKGYEQFAENDRRLAKTRDLDLAQANAGYQRAKGALDAQAGVEAKMQRAHANILQQRESFIRESAELDKTMSAQARAESEAHLDAYRQQIAAVRQMTVTNPIAALGGFETAGVSLAMFAQGFLAARGINIDVAGQVNRWVDRSIEEQQRRIGQAQQGAEDELNLWRIAQETSRNDLEARHRYRGMVLEAMTTAVDVNAARFAAPLAKSAAEVAKAKLAMEQTGVERTIRHGYETDRLANLKAMRDEAHMRVMERFRSQELAIQSRAQKAAAAKAQKPLNYIQDTRNVVRDENGKPISGGRVVAAFQENAPEQTQKAVIEAQTAHDNMQTGLDRLRKLYKDLDGEVGPGWLRQRQSEAYKLFDAERTRIIGDLQKSMTGLAAPESEQKRWLSQLSDDAMLQVGPDRLPKLIDGMSEWGRKRFENTLHLPGVIVLPENDRFHTQDVTIDPDTQALTDARSHVRIPSTIEQISGPAATDSTRYVERKPSAFYREQQSQREQREVPSLNLDKMKARATGRTESWAGQLDDLARAAVDPKGFLVGKSNTDATKRYSENTAEVQRQALMDLASIASGRPLAEGQPAPPAARRAYAKALMDMYDSNPDQLKKMLSE